MHTEFGVRWVKKVVNQIGTRNLAGVVERQQAESLSRAGCHSFCLRILRTPITFYRKSHLLIRRKSLPLHSAIELNQSRRP